ncbi:MAG: DUF2231 domain-containing protein [Candidatus Sumerlaeaceae bacterium]
MLKELLQGAWLKHPLHPVVISLPLGLWPISLLLDGYSHAAGGSTVAVTGSFYALLVGLAGALVAVATGLADFSEIKPGKPARKIGIQHMVLNATGTLFWIASLALHLPARNGQLSTTPVAAIICSGVALIATCSAAYLGGRMVYNHGIGVARYSKKRLRQIAAAAGNNVPGEEEGA